MSSSMQNLYALHGRARGLGALDLQINKGIFSVSEAPFYTVTGAAPDAAVLWSSTRDGLPTGETLTDYGHRTDGVGVWSQAGGNWTIDHIGQWTKTVKVGGETDTVAFQVLPVPGVASPAVQTVTVPGATQVPVAPADDTIELFGYQLPRMAVYIGGGLLAYLLLRKK